MQPQIHLYLKIRCTRPLHTNSFTRIIFICAINRNLQLKLFINEINPEQIIIYFFYFTVIKLGKTIFRENILNLNNNISHICVM